MINNILNHILNFAIALGTLVLATAAVNALAGSDLELWHTAPFLALWHAVRHNPPPFKD
jgi:hypothetical protein